MLKFKSKTSFILVQALPLGAHHGKIPFFSVKNNQEDPGGAFKPFFPIKGFKSFLFYYKSGLKMKNLEMIMAR
jgi:hypothetical protein